MSDAAAASARERSHVPAIARLHAPSKPARPAAGELQAERDELKLDLDDEREELALLFRAQGLPAAEAERLASRLIGDDDSALDALAG